MTKPPPKNDRPCGLCRHIDDRVLASGLAYCWRRYFWVDPDKVVETCADVERADGSEPPGRLHFEGPRK